MTKKDPWEEFGRNLVVPASLITFVWAWWYCAATYGFLLGFGLGWLPAAILAALVGGFVWLAWPLAIAALGLGLLAGVLSLASCVGLIR